MAKITVEIPDELLPRLVPYQDRLPGLLNRWVTGLEVLPDVSGVAQPRSGWGLYQEIVDFLLTQPDPQAILSFKISEKGQGRLGELLEKNRVVQLTGVEIAELDLYEQLDRVMRLLKIRAFALLNSGAEAAE